MTEPRHGVLHENLIQFGSVLDEILDAAIAISGADFGNIQLIDPTTSELRIVAHRGYPKWWLDFWNSVSAGEGTCGTALARGERVIVEDVESSPIFTGTPALEIQRRAGVRAVQSTPIVSGEGKPLGMFSTHYKMPRRPDERGLLLLDLLARQAADIIERKQAVEALEQMRNMLNEAQRIAHLGSFEYIAATKTTKWSEEEYRIYGLDPAAPSPLYEDMLARCIHPDDAALLHQSFTEAIRNNGIYELEHRIVRPDGSVRWVYDRAHPYVDADGKLLRYVGATLDITERKEQERVRQQAEEQLRQLAHHDTLTGLPNRLAFAANLEKALERARRRKKKVVLLFLDLDRFKQVNDSLGHAKGDQLLQVIAIRLQQGLRGEDMAARLGGDEFTVILEEITNVEDAASVAQKIIMAVSVPIVLDGHELVTFTSIGISIYPDDADNAVDLAKAADAAMYRAKSRGRRTYEFYTPELTQSAMQRLATEQGLRQALAQEQFELYYQPQIEVASGQTCGVEALLRWHHPTMGMLLPGQFIGIAEDCGLIDEVGDWVLQQACTQAAQWQESAVRPLRIAINLSGHQIMYSSTAEKIQKRLQQSGLNLGQMQVQLEITETALLESGEKIFDVLKNLRELGVSIAIDDFGTGYSSLSRLKQLPIDTLKIDGSFLCRISEDTDNMAIVSAILSMGHSLGLRVIAEGVETQSQLDFIRAQGGNEAQGFYIGRPLPAAEVAPFLQGRAALAHAS